MALLATYGGADDLRLCQNRISAGQAGAVIPAPIQTIPLEQSVEPVTKVVLEPKATRSKKVVE